MSDKPTVGLSYAPPPSVPRRRGLLRRVLVALSAAVGLVLVLPVGFALLLLVGHYARDLTPPRALADQMQADLGFALPADVRQTNATRQPSGIDPASFYELSVPPERLAALLNQLRSAARARQWDTSDSPGNLQMEHDAPTWWTPGGLTLRLFNTRPGGNGYYIHYSDGDGRVYVYWFNT